VTHQELEGSKSIVDSAALSIGAPVNHPPLVADLEDGWIERWYAELEERILIDDSPGEELRHLCDAEQNAEQAVHSWYTLKEAFSADFPAWVVRHLHKTYGFRPENALDPFSGGGTSLITLSLLGIDVTGVEYNPFIAWVAKVKSSWHLYDVVEIEQAIENLSTLTVPAYTRMAWPQLSTFKNTKYFRRNDVRTLLHVLLQIEELDVTLLTKQFLRIGVAAVIEEISNLRKDGRALRYVQKPLRPSASMALVHRWRRNLEQLETLHDRQSYEQRRECRVWLGSALNLTNLLDPWDQNTDHGLQDSSYDLVLYSPPYLNNFDYSEVYKLELWLLGFLESYEQWGAMRRGTIRSHHSVKFPETSRLTEDSALADMAQHLRELGKSDYLRGYSKENMPPVILGYFDDMYATLKEQYRVLKPGGFLAYMVANSRHSDLPIATDVILGEIARVIGFEPLELIVFHKRNGRTRKKRFLRESTVTLRKPD
jgi:DNA modification methylase